MPCKSYDLEVVVEAFKEKGGARRDLINDDDDTVVLPRFRPRTGNNSMSLPIFIVIHRELQWCFLYGYVLPHDLVLPAGLLLPL